MDEYSGDAARASEFGSCLAFILAGGRGSRLHELTSLECKPALPFGASCRIIDFAFANVHNSGIRNMIVAAQYMPSSLISHLRSRWRPYLGASGSTMTMVCGSADDEQRSFNGTAGALSRNIALIDSFAPRHVLILAADHVYQMDYREMIGAHVRAGADVTIGAHVVPRNSANAFGVMQTTDDGLIRQFHEKPADPSPMPGDEKASLASMGIYVFDWPRLRETLLADALNPLSSHDFGNDILPLAISGANAYAHILRPVAGAERSYWRDVGTLASYHEAHMELLTTGLLHSLDRAEWPLHFGERPKLRANTIYETASLVSPVGTQVEGQAVQSVVSQFSRVGAGCLLDCTVMMPRSSVKGRVRLTNAILAPDTRIHGSLTVGEDPKEDAQWFRRTPEGITLITQQMLDRREDTVALTHGWRRGMDLPSQFPGWAAHRK